MGKDLEAINEGNQFSVQRNRKPGTGAKRKPCNHGRCLRCEVLVHALAWGSAPVSTEKWTMYWRDWATAGGAQMRQETDSGGLYCLF